MPAREAIGREGGAGVPDRRPGVLATLAHLGTGYVMVNGGTPLATVG